jgi:hypothetical protein
MLYRRDAPDRPDHIDRGDVDGQPSGAIGQRFAIQQRAEGAPRGPAQRRDQSQTRHNNLFVDVTYFHE